MTSPAQTRSHRAASTVGVVVVGAPAAAAARTRSAQNEAPRCGEVGPQRVVHRALGRARRRRARAPAGRPGRGTPAGPGRRWSRAAPAPTHTTSPAVQSASRSAGLVARPCGRAGRRSRAPTPGWTRRPARRAPRPGRRGPAGAGRRPATAGRKRPSAAAVDRLDLGAQHGQRAPAELAQHLGVAPLPLGAAGPELAADQAAVGHQRVEHGADPVGVDAEPRRRRRGRGTARGCGRSGRPGPRAARRPGR